MTAAPQATPINELADRALALMKDGGSFRIMPVNDPSFSSHTFSGEVAQAIAALADQHEADTEKRIAAAVAAAYERAASATGWEDHVSDDAPKYLSDWQRGLVTGQQAMTKAIRALATQAEVIAAAANKARNGDAAKPKRIKKIERALKYAINRLDGDDDAACIIDLEAALAALSKIGGA